MLAFLADENFHGPVVTGLRERFPQVDIVRAQDVGLGGLSDEVILQWAADHGRVLLTHDQSTMPGFAYARVGAGLSMAGVVIVGVVPVERLVEEIALLGICGVAGDVENQVLYMRI